MPSCFLCACDLCGIKVKVRYGKESKQDIRIAGGNGEIMELGRNSGLSAEFYKKAGRYIRAVSSKLSMTPVQSVLLSAFINSMTDSRILLSELAQYFNCSTIRIIKNVNEIDDLERRRYIRCSHASRQRSYRVPLEVLDALKEDRPYVPESYSGMSMERLVAALGENLPTLRRTS